MKKIHILLLFILAIILVSCKKRDCTSITKEFTTDTEAKEYIKSRRYKIKDSIKVLNSNLMIAANYYSCDGVTGYFSFKRESDRDFFSGGIPLKIWLEFKISRFKEDYYENVIMKIAKPAFTIVHIVDE